MANLEGAFQKYVNRLRANDPAPTPLDEVMKELCHEIHGYPLIDVTYEGKTYTLEVSSEDITIEARQCSVNVIDTPMNEQFKNDVLPYLNLKDNWGFRMFEKCKIHEPYNFECDSFCKFIQSDSEQYLIRVYCNIRAKRKKK